MVFTKNMNIKLQNLANNFRKDILKMVYAASSGHLGGAFSIIDILTTLFYKEFIKFNPQNPKWEQRDYLILSKGHASAALYSILGSLGYFSKDELFNFRQLDSMLQGHPTPHTPGVEVASGALGQGLSVASGIALGLKIDKKNNKVFVIIKKN